MATLNILTPEELAHRDQKPPRRTGRKRSLKRSRIIEGFKEVLQQAKSGYSADVLPSEDEDKRTVRTNLKDAAGELGLALEFHPFKDKCRMHFRVITPEEKAARPTRSGRPRKAPPEALAETSQEPITEPQQGTSGNGTEPAAAPPRARRRRNQQQASAE